jgi:chromosome partitioning protein
LSKIKTVSIINLKGGVGKTISAANIAHILATIHNFKVLLADNDKQGNISKMFGLHNENAPSISDVLTVRGMNLNGIIKPTVFANLDVLPANMSLLEANREVLLDVNRPQQTRFSKAFESIAGRYDYCIIDNAPDINISTINAMTASDDIIIPVKIDKFTFDGLNELQKQIAVTREEFNPRLAVRGCLITSYQNNEVNRQGEAYLRENSTYPVFVTRIRRTEKVDESTFASAPILEHSRRCAAAKDYIAFVEEYLGACKNA